MESFVPTFAVERGLLYRTGKRLTRYKIHGKSSSIPLTREGQARALTYVLRAIEDHKLMLENSTPENRAREGPC